MPEHKDLMITFLEKIKNIVLWVYKEQ
jgi:hypothetical protein